MPRVQLKTAHTHAGQHHAPGERLEVESSIARWLIQQGIALADRIPAKPIQEPKEASE